MARGKKYRGECSGGDWWGISARGVNSQGVGDLIPSCRTDKL